MNRGYKYNMHHFNDDDLFSYIKCELVDSFSLMSIENCSHYPVKEIIIDNKLKIYKTCLICALLQERG